MYNFWACALFAVASLTIGVSTGSTETFGLMVAAWCAAMFAICEIRKGRSGD